MDKNITFSITHGRTGTQFVTKLFELFSDTLSQHEPDPNFASVFVQVKDDPRIAVKFWETKLDVISKYAQANYVETSNVFGKGYFLPLVRAFDIYPNLLLITRDFRDTAKSLYKRKSTPVRSSSGMMYSCHPEQPGTLPIFAYQGLTDYQLCYWAVLDSYYRQMQAEDIYKDKGLSNYMWLTADDLHDFSTFQKAGEVCGLVFDDEEEAEKRHKEISGTIYNANPERAVEDVDDMAKQEAIVLDRIAYFDILTVEKILKSKYAHDDVKAHFQ